MLNVKKLGKARICWFVLSELGVHLHDIMSSYMIWQLDLHEKQARIKKQDVLFQHMHTHMQMHKSTRNMHEEHNEQKQKQERYQKSTNTHHNERRRHII